jgi:hypothetical protein
MTSTDLALALLAHAKSSDPTARVVVYTATDDHSDGDKNCLYLSDNADQWDVSDAIKALAGWFAVEVEEARESAT